MVTLLLFVLMTFLYGYSTPRSAIHGRRRFSRRELRGDELPYMWILLLIAALMMAVAIFMMKLFEARRDRPRDALVRVTTTGTRRQGLWSAAGAP
ncbi:MAG: hypothetical protein ACREX9_02185 [Gammaproteobacteria bacterium]